VVAFGAARASHDLRAFAEQPLAEGGLGLAPTTTAQAGGQGRLSFAPAAGAAVTIELEGRFASFPACSCLPLFSSLFCSFLFCFFHFFKS